MQELMNECYKWMQVLLVARSCQERLLYLGADESKLQNEDVLNRYNTLMSDLYTDKFVDYSLFRLSCILWEMCRYLSKDKNTEAADIINQTITMIVMISNNLLSPDGKYIHKIGSDSELDNVKAFDKKNSKNLQPFADLLNELVLNENEFMTFQVVAHEYSILNTFEEMLFDVEYMLIVKDELLKIGNVTKEDMNEFIDLCYDKIKYGIELLNEINKTYSSLQHVLLEIIRGKTKQFIKFADSELEQLKLFGIEHKANNLYGVYSKHLLNFMEASVAYEGLGETIISWINYPDE